MPQNRSNHPTLVRSALAALALGLVALTSCGLAADGQTASADATSAADHCRGGRVDIVDLSQSQRRRTDEVVRLLAAEFAGAVICGEPITAVAVAGGASETLLTEADAKILQLDLQNKRARAHRIEGKVRAIDEHIRGRLAAALAKLEDSGSTAVERYYDLAGQYARGGDRVVIMTDGVQQDGTIDLERALAEGEGADLAATLSVDPLPRDVSVLVVGVGDHPSEADHVGAGWVREVVAFNQELCDRASSSCDVRSTASTADLAAP